MPESGPIYFLTVVAWLLAAPMLLMVLYLAWRKFGPHGRRKRRRRRMHHRSQW